MRVASLAVACLLSACAPGLSPTGTAKLPITVASQGAGAEASAGATGLPLSGQFYSGSVPFYTRNVPLPPGRWTELTSRSLGAARTGPLLGSLTLVQGQGTQLSAMISISGNSVPLRTGFPLHTLCTAADALWNDSRAANPNGEQDCAAVTFLRPVEWRARPDTFDAQIMRGLDQIGLRAPDFVVGYGITEADLHWQLVVVLVRNPDLAGVPPDPATQRARSAWRPAVLPADPKRAKYVEELKAEVPPYRQRLRDALDGAMPATPRAGLTPA